MHTESRARFWGNGRENTIAHVGDELHEVAAVDTRVVEAVAGCVSMREVSTETNTRPRAEDGHILVSRILVACSHFRRGVEVSGAAGNCRRQRRS